MSGEFHFATTMDEVRDLDQNQDAWHLDDPEMTGEVLSHVRHGGTAVALISSFHTGFRLPSGTDLLFTDSCPEDGPIRKQAEARRHPMDMSGVSILEDVDRWAGDMLLKYVIPGETTVPAGGRTPVRAVDPVSHVARLTRILEIRDTAARQVLSERPDVARALNYQNDRSPGVALMSCHQVLPKEVAKPVMMDFSERMRAIGQAVGIAFPDTEEHIDQKTLLQAWDHPLKAENPFEGSVLLEMDPDTPSPED